MQKKILLVLIGILFYSINMIKACTIFSCSRGGEVFAAANEDDTTPFTRIWYNPTTRDRYGSVCFGGPDMQVASAMNEYGLFFDFAAANYDISKLKQLNIYKGFLMWEVLGKCKNVKEAIAIIKKYDYNSPSQVLLADKEGNSILINPKGIIEKKGEFQVNANCNSINGKLSCRRPEIVNEELSASKNISLDFFKNILNKTHQEGDLPTLYSTICDLKRGIIYVYLFHDYNNVYTIDLKAELKKGYRIENLADHFPVSFAYESFSKNHSLYAKESILQEMKIKGTDSTIDYYLAESSKQLPQNKNLDSALLEVALQLVKYSWNEHTHGGMWDYWFSFPKGYEIQQYQDARLTSAEKIFNYLSEKENPDLKLKNFIYEMYGYVNLIQGDHTTAKEYYNKSVSNPEDSYKVTLIRGKEILSRIR
ncbi:carcinine hydrolase/isopenicillin-N N-acyltransferase family protein [Chryseobacterium sp. WG23]|uniref:carcinine hydrolase/isopenicillin-N N-acyltransferase family protein n=1 Tax=Chryseobacterium sp. WG23 TaxID=2926910 RepID=UPI00211DD286|nr:carcinine hydrolase/isopenicillin-N N-acyltransferase family protein [Chryseobacterium sp. WG23]MCQ9635590.1 carcinine hydrolase/isopenicillin-N N-acyltransferase family protein [Chryseobacterium sp. WG23]